MGASGNDGDQHPLYTDLAPWFHLLTSPEDYGLDARHALDVLAETIGEPPRTILELGSGGGNSASHMKAHATLTLTDLSEQMLELSRTINPEVEHVQGDMRTLRLGGRTFDAVFVHDAVSYLLTEHDLRATFETALAHLRPGGAAIFEPDITREAYADATHQGGHDGADGRSLRYLQWRTDPDSADTWYVDEFAILLHEADGTSRIAHDVHRLGMFPRATWIELLTDVGFVDVRGVPSPYDDEGVGAESFVGRRPA
jgi:SAM-dependent methyltransferase